MEARLDKAPSTLTLVKGFQLKDEASILVHCHDREFKNVIIVDEDGIKLFTAESRGIGSWSWRRTVRDASGTELFDLRRFGWALKNTWSVESSSGHKIASLRHLTYLQRQRSTLDVILSDEVVEGNEVVVKVRPQDSSALTTLVSIRGVDVAEIRPIESNDVLNLKGRDRSVWKARVAANTDLSLIVAIVLCRAEMHHVWRR